MSNFTKEFNSAVTANNVKKKQEMRFARLAIGIILTFGFCCLPWSIYATLYVLEGVSKEHRVIKHLVMFVPFLLNSLLNPFLYFSIMSKWKICGKRMFWGIKKHERKVQNTSKDGSQNNKINTK